MSSEQKTQTYEHLDYTKPPFLHRVRIREYKSIRFCDVGLQPLTILVGRNAAGKSNFLDALAFLGDSMEAGVAEAVKRRGGWRSVVSRTTETENPCFFQGLLAERERFELSLRFPVNSIVAGVSIVASLTTYLQWSLKNRSGLRRHVPFAPSPIPLPNYPSIRDVLFKSSIPHF